jgi:hypothetical protein
MSLSFGGIYKPATGGGEDPGLALVVSSSFSAASSVSLDGCFTSAYANYRIVANITAISGSSVNVLMRLRAASTDNSDANNYRWGSTVYISNGTSANTSSTNSYFFLTFLDDSACVSALALDLYRPAVADDTHISGFVTRGKPGDHGAINTLAGLHDDATAFDGLTLYPSTGTFTGTVRVYGYRSS